MDASPRPRRAFLGATRPGVEKGFFAYQWDGNTMLSRRKRLGGRL
jgi:hypothetical protein